MENIIMNIVVLIFEILYYSLFMKYARKEGKFWRYIISGIITTLLLLIVGSNNLIGLLVLIISLFISLKYIVKLKTGLYDMFFVIIMIFIKLIIESCLSLPLYNILNNIYYVSTITGITKCTIVLLLGYKINWLYTKLKKIWYDNNFYIRYIFACMCFVYCILAVLFLITKFI